MLLGSPSPVILPLSQTQEPKSVRQSSSPMIAAGPTVAGSSSVCVKVKLCVLSQYFLEKIKKRAPTEPRTKTQVRGGVINQLKWVPASLLYITLSCKWVLSASVYQQRLSALSPSATCHREAAIKAQKASCSKISQSQRCCSSLMGRWAGE